jgi:serine/threonine-protein kinase
MAAIISDTTLRRVEAVLGPRFRLDQPIAASAERLLFLAHDTLLKREVSIRVNIDASDGVRRWFVKEAEALGRLDHPAIRHVYEAGVIGDVAYRVGNWIEGESLADAVQRGPRPIPAVHVLARDLLGALEHAHARGIIVRRIVPAGMVLTLSGRGCVTDLRFCNLTLPEIPPGEKPSGTPFLAPEVREGRTGDPTSDIYTAGAILYYTVTATVPPLDAAQLVPPRAIRSIVPAALERVILRALEPDPRRRYLTAIEMLEDFTNEAGAFETAGVSLTPLPIDLGEGPHWEARLRRALGDDYELLGTLGEGGFGRVYRVRDLHLEREVALKVLHPHLTRDAATVERFRKEAQLAARLTHPNIVSIYDIAGRSGLLWYTMEIVDGPNLGQLVAADGPMPVDRVLRLLREALSALGHAHSLGLVHRDIKPENMLLETDGSLRITDFGLALALRGTGRFGGATSRSGTPQFASPEQLLGERVDQRTDLYSLAAVAFFALLGRPPFAGGTVEQILAKQTGDVLPDLVSERPDVTEVLSAVIARGLRNNVDARWSSAGDFRAAIEDAAQQSLRRKGSDLARLAARILGT